VVPPVLNEVLNDVNTVVAVFANDWTVTVVTVVVSRIKMLVWVTLVVSRRTTRDVNIVTVTERKLLVYVVVLVVVELVVTVDRSMMVRVVETLTVEVSVVVVKTVCKSSVRGV
jgi:hypothetical protein